MQLSSSSPQSKRSQFIENLELIEKASSNPNSPRFSRKRNSIGNVLPQNIPSVPVPLRNVFNEEENGVDQLSEDRNSSSIRDVSPSGLATNYTTHPMTKGGNRVQHSKKKKASSIVESNSVSHPESSLSETMSDVNTTEITNNGSKDDSPDESTSSMSQKKKSRKKDTSSYAHGVFKSKGNNKYECQLRPEHIGKKPHQVGHSGPISNLWSHLAFWHPKAKAALEKAAAEGENPKVVASALKEAWSISPSHNQTMDRFLRVALQKPGKTEKELVLTIWAIHCSISGYSFSNKHWQLLCEKFNLALCGATTMMDNRVPVLHHLVKRKIIANLENVASVAVSIDGWKSSGSCEGAGKLVGISYSYVTSVNNILQSRSHLDFIPVNVSHTGALLDAVVWGRITETVGKNTLISAIVTDNGSNFRLAASRLCGLENSFPCLAHTLQLVYSDLQAENTQLNNDLLLVQVIPGFYLLFLKICRVWSTK
jgi:hypothetical protein